MSNKSFNEFESEGQGNKLLKKSKDSPFVPIVLPKYEVQREFRDKVSLHSSYGSIASSMMMIASAVTILPPIGMAGFFAVAAMGLYNYKNRGKVSTSVYLMQLRVAAQGTVVGAMCLGLIYSMVDRYVLNKPTNTTTTTTSTNQH